MIETEVAPTAPVNRWVGAAILAIAVAMSLFHLYAIAIEPPEAFPFRAWHLAFSFALLFLLYPLIRKGGQGRVRWWDIAALVAAVGTCLYVIVFYKPYIFERDPFVDSPGLDDSIFAVLCIVMILEGSRRILGLSMTLTVGAFLAYAVIFHRIDFATYVNQLYLTTEGIFGQTLGVSASYVLIFVLFGAFMERAGTGQLFMDFALSLTGHSAGGPGKVAVVSSSLFGTISGSAVANVMIDGPITIPLMKRTGFSAHFGAAIEAVASTGGQIMPPIMGAAAFVMAEFLNVAYFQVVVWAIIPAALYYVACFAAVHFEAKRQGIKGLPKSECPRLREVVATRGHLFLPIVVIVVVMFTGSSAPMAALAGTAACVPLIYLRGKALWFPMMAGLIVGLVVGGGLPQQWRKGAFDLVAAWDAFEVSGSAVVWATAATILVTLIAALFRRDVSIARGHWAAIEALAEGAKNALSVAIACAAAGIVIGVIAFTGIGIDFTQVILRFAQDSLLLALIVTAAAGIILGAGLPTTPAYIIMVALLVPALVKLGIVLPAAHMFAFYFAILSSITPPVALAVFAAASLAKADMWKTGWAAMRVGASGYIVPFMFAYEPALLLIVKPGQWYEAVIATASATAGCVALSAGLYGYFLRHCGWIERIALVAGAFLLIKPGWITDLIGFGLLAGVAVYQTLENRRAAARGK